MKTRISSISVISFSLFLNAVISSFVNAQSIAAGANHSIFLCSNSTPMISGSNLFGQHGNGTSDFTAHPNPVAVSLTNIKAVYAASSHSIYLKNDGTVWACGNNGDGELGNGTTAHQPNLIQVNISDVIDIAAGQSHTLFLKSDSTVWACGHNDDGQLGDGTIIAQSTPFQIQSLSGIIAISAGDAHSLFLRSDGSVWACGYNLSGQLGDGTTVNKHIPTQITSLNSIIAIDASKDGFHSLFLKNDGTVWACGLNSDGQLGDGTTLNKLTPVQVNTVNNIIAICAGSEFSLYLKNDGTVYSCGFNSEGQLGDGTMIDKSSPVLISSLNQIVDIAAGDNHSLFLKNDGTVWACGRNDKGQLADATTVDRSTPIQVSGICAILSVSEFDLENSANFYPNPSNGIFSIKSYTQGSVVLLYNMQGVLIFYKELDGELTNIDLRGFAKGVYFYQIRNQAEGIQSGKIIFQ
ncbi:MAG: T9SS type A sorting domain-containing protein [Candidatus Competibacteraceae bacterium]|nr:T9SS type A sorting domain-containing protein [Candidatus Competibacteraceae bacterium]